jgi:opacity protein-like surface antigen
MTVDVAWRYTDHGAIETSSGEGRVVWRDGSRQPLQLDLGGTRGQLRSHGLNVTLRYTF